MDHSITFARHFARLHWLLLNEPDNVEEQKASLRALVTISRDGPVTLARAGEDDLQANGQPIPAVVSGAREVAARLALHDARELAVQVAAQAGDLLAAARLMAGEREGTSIEERLRLAGSTTVHFALGPDRGAPGLPAGFDLILDLDEPIAPTVVAPPADPPPPRAVDPRAGAAEYHRGSSLFDQFTAARPVEGPDALLGELEAAADASLGNVMHRVAQALERAGRDGDGRTVLTLLLGTVEREARAGDGARREIGLVLRRAVGMRTLQLVAALVPRRVVARGDVQRVLARLGEDGADAVIELLTQAPTATDRRAYFDLLLSLKAGVPTLLHMLGDDRWYVVRNAVDLLGELGTPEAEQPITALLRHADERVRQSATMALLRMNTPAGRAAVLTAVESESAEQRQQAIVALGARTDANTASMLLRALDREEDEGVQRAIYAALGRVASPDAVERLIRAAEPAGGFFRRRPAALRAAAVLALGEARTPAAVEALRGLVDDKEKDVRDAALRALANARRGNEPRVTGLFDAVRKE